METWRKIELPTRRRWLISLLAIVTCGGLATAQSPYSLEWKRELGIGGIGLSTYAVSSYLKSQATLYTSEQLESLDATEIGGLDRLATLFDSEAARQTSDILLKGSTILPLALLLPKETRHDAATIGVLWAETMLVNAGVTALSKHTFRRPRPFVYNPETTASEIQTIHAQTAFLSGHTSTTAANCFFAAKVFSDYFPDSEWTPVVWSVAATVPAITGYLRVKGGRHYPSDVIAGYALGACVGYLVPQLHKTRFTVNGLPGTVRLDAGFSSMRLRWVF